MSQNNPENSTDRFAIQELEAQSKFERAFRDAVHEYGRAADKPDMALVRVTGGTELVMTVEQAEALAKVYASAEVLDCSQGWHLASLGPAPALQIKRLSGQEYVDLKMAAMMGIDYGEFRTRRKREYHLSEHFREMEAQQKAEIAAFERQMEMYKAQLDAAHATMLSRQDIVDIKTKLIKHPDGTTPTEPVKKATNFLAQCSSFFFNPKKFYGGEP